MSIPITSCFGTLSSLGASHRAIVAGAEDLRQVAASVAQLQGIGAEVRGLAGANGIASLREQIRRSRPKWRRLHAELRRLPPHLRSRLMQLPAHRLLKLRLIEIRRAIGWILKDSLEAVVRLLGLAARLIDEFCSRLAQMAAPAFVAALPDRPPPTPLGLRAPPSQQPDSGCAVVGGPLAPIDISSLLA